MQRPAPTTAPGNHNHNNSTTANNTTTSPRAASPAPTGAGIAGRTRMRDESDPKYA
jgi:hypothetical protein